MKDVDRIVQFIARYATYTNLSAVRREVEAHIKYKTCRVVADKDGDVCCVCLWNISPDCKYADITDLIIREDERNKGIAKKILSDELKRWNFKYVRFERGYDDGNIEKTKKVYDAQKLLRRLVC